MKKSNLVRISDVKNVIAISKSQQGKLKGGNDGVIEEDMVG